MLLPVHGDEEEEDDPRLEIARPLAEYLQVKSAAEELARRNMLGDKIFTRRPNLKKYMQEDQDVIQVGLFELIDAFQKILNKVSQGHTVDMGSDQISIKDRMNELIAVMEEKGSITFTELFDGACEKSYIIVTFLAVLELMKLNLTHVVQHSQSGIIRIFYQ
jgi:segregation and condensation protein A